MVESDLFYIVWKFQPSVFNDCGARIVKRTNKHATSCSPCKSRPWTWLSIQSELDFTSLRQFVGAIKPHRSKRRPSKSFSRDKLFGRDFAKDFDECCFFIALFFTILCHFKVETLILMMEIESMKKSNIQIIGLVFVNYKPDSTSKVWRCSHIWLWKAQVWCKMVLKNHPGVCSFWQVVARAERRARDATSCFWILWRLG